MRQWRRQSAAVNTGMMCCQELGTSGGVTYYNIIRVMIQAPLKIGGGHSMCNRLGFYCKQTALFWSFYLQKAEIIRLSSTIKNSQITRSET